MDNEKGKSIIPTGTSNLAKTEKLLSITQKILSEIKPQYESIKIGNQEWMTRNLDVDRFRNGDLIPHVESDKEWKEAGSNSQPAWCYYDNDPDNGKKYGKLYNWYAANDPRGLAPEGYHIPNGYEWSSLLDYLGPRAFEILKSEDDWDGKNEVSFNGLPGGFRDYYGVFSHLGLVGLWWSSSVYYDFNVIFLHLDTNGGYELRNDGHDMGDGFSVRCLRDY
jgi:uncharacterized protein (TIGR02145 family)